MELTIKHLAAYLPYGLEIAIDNNHGKGINKNLSILNITENGFNSQLHYQLDIGAITIFGLRPLSDLTKEIEHNGEKFVPLFELFKLIHDYHFPYNILLNESEISYQIDDGWNHVMSFNDIGLDFGYDQYEQRFHFMYDGQCYDFNYIEMHEKLLEWHFDVFDLIGNDLAININTLKQ